MEHKVENSVEGLTIRTLKGDQIHPFIDNLAELRITVFKEYPYLYEGNFDYERGYLKTYTACDEAILVLVQEDSHIVGASTAIPLEFETQECQKSFKDNHFQLRDVFYFGESVLLPSYRNKGVYKHFFQARERAAIDYGCKMVAFCGVERDANDVRRPPNFVPLDKVWRHFGYKKHPTLCAYYEWLEINQEQSTTKTMKFWTKNL